MATLIYSCKPTGSFTNVSVPHPVKNKHLYITRGYGFSELRKEELRKKTYIGDFKKGIISQVKEIRARHKLINNIKWLTK